MAGPSDNVFAGLALQVARAGIEIRGMSAIVSGAGQAMKSVATLISGQVVTALQSFIGAVGKATAGLTAIGAAALPGGFKVLGEVMEYLTAVIGSVGVPIFVVLGAAVLTLADYIAGPFMIAAKAVAGWLGDNLVPAIQKVILALEAFMDALYAAGLYAQKKFAEAIAYIANVKVDTSRYETGIAQHLMDMFGKINQLSNGAGGGDAFGEGVGKTFADNLEKMLQSLMLQQGKQGQVGVSGLADVWKQVQMQSFVSPIEREKLNRWKENIELVKQMVKELQDLNKKPAAVGP